ncbi:unnamed protein product [Cladocopium goreaui]|uniref:Uncharacterized protein n=1 Tax=Cladocopium goreaui TaxID=2562237 RepID=A0A9P1FR85_9DINO|nr:unnamed protein product [Cladocopium goreaui]
MQFRSWLVGALSFFFLSGVLQGCRQESTTDDHDDHGDHEGHTHTDTVTMTMTTTVAP